MICYWQKQNLEIIIVGYMLFLDNLPRWCFGDYQENEKDRLMILERIQSKIDLKPNYYRNKRNEHQI